MSPFRSSIGRHAATALFAIVAVLAIGAISPAAGGWRPTGQANAAPSATDTGGPTRGITVEGIGRITVGPDLATVSVGIKTQGSNAAAAQSKASAAMARIVAAVKAHGVAATDLATQWISLQPQYDYGPNGSTPPAVVGYQASQTLAIKVHHVDKAGQVIDAAVGAGANQVGGISFSISDPTAASAQARAAAVADARARAAALAGAAGVTLGAALSISEVSSPAPTPIPYAYPQDAQGAAKTPVQPGTTDVEVNVQVVFAIGS